MPTTLVRSTVLLRLAELDRNCPRRRIFGASSHQYGLNPPLPVSVVEGFEGRHGVSLPEDYRLFITEVGNGGAGPHYGLLPFGKDDDDRDWEGGGLVGDPGKPFPHTTAWNLPDSFWDGEPDWPPDTPVEEQDRLMEAWDRELELHYWNPAIMDGAIPICHKGCALRQWLVIQGEHRGAVWDDLQLGQRHGQGPPVLPGHLDEHLPPALVLGGYADNLHLVADPQRRPSRASPVPCPDGTTTWSMSR